MGFASWSIAKVDQGNITSDGISSYGYDLNNRLKTASKAGTSAMLAYDAERRLRQSEIAMHPAAETD